MTQIHIERRRYLYIITTAQCWGRVHYSSHHYSGVIIETQMPSGPCTKSLETDLRFFKGKIGLKVTIFKGSINYVRLVIPNNTQY